ncbi:MAG: SIR2 family protein, partial [Caldilineaceae bacterium]|nr:SIR2 family protein [Caldilineaceae bacterium]
LEHLPSVRDDDPDYRPSPEEPLIYYLFGNLDEPGSVVLTEDDYFDFLIGVTSNKDLIPEFVRRYMVDSALLFLGFGLDEQDFRVLFRSIMKREGRRRRSGYAHVAAQINPEEGRILEPERARAYLETYFDDAAISIFWGSAHDFIGELQARMKKE